MPTKNALTNAWRKPTICQPRKQYASELAITTNLNRAPPNNSDFIEGQDSGAIIYCWSFITAYFIKIGYNNNKNSSFFQFNLQFNLYSAKIAGEMFEFHIKVKKKRILILFL